MAGARFGGVRAAGAQKRHQGRLDVGAVGEKKMLSSREQVVHLGGQLSNPREEVRRLFQEASDL